MNQIELSMMKEICLEAKPIQTQCSIVIFMLLIDSFRRNFLVVLLECGEVFSSLGELAFLHAFTDIPVNERALGVHEVELVVDSREDLGDGGVVADHADGALDFGEVASGDN